ncbi:MAG: M15 family metallopeptidase [Nitrospirota bacterium]
MLTARQTELNDSRLNTLLPEVREIAKRHLGLCTDKSVYLLVVQAYRSFDSQESLYRSGRSEPGLLLTNARPGYSWHNFGRAYDVAVIEDGQIVWDSPKYRTAGEIGNSLGLVWGGDFTSVHGDLGHFEYHPGLTMAEARMQMKA